MLCDTKLLDESSYLSAETVCPLQRVFSLVGTFSLYVFSGVQVYLLRNTKIALLLPFIQSETILSFYTFFGKTNSKKIRSYAVQLSKDVMTHDVFLSTLAYFTLICVL